MDESVESVIQLTEIMQEVTNIIKHYFKVDLDEDSILYYRYMNHMLKDYSIAKYMKDKMIQNLWRSYSANTKTHITVPMKSQISSAVVLGIWMKPKNQKLREVSFPVWVSGIFGVTEPAIYKVGQILYPKLYWRWNCRLLGAEAYTMTGMGVFALAGFVPETGTSLEFYWVY